jgi:hypothetical protein
MDLNLIKYVVVMQGIIDKKLCKKTINELKKVKNWDKHTFYDHIKKESLSLPNDLSINYSNVKTDKLLKEKIILALNTYLKILNFEWFDQYKEFVQIRFNKYSIKTKMAEHCDHIHSMFDGNRKGIPVLSIVGLLNDDYKGGEFIMFQDRKIELKTGDILIFPSNFLFPHRVEPITKGTRYSFVSWAI